MRAWHVGVVGVLVAALAFTGCSPSTGGGDSSKLKTDIVGKWEGKSGEKTATIEFKDDGTYTYETDKSKVKGKWKAVDDKNIEEVFTLTKEEAEILKPVVQVTNEAIDLYNKIPLVTKLEKTPEPKEGENTWKLAAEVKDKELTLAGQKYTKK